MLNCSIDSSECTWWMCDRWFTTLQSSYNELVIPFPQYHAFPNCWEICSKPHNTLWFGGCSIKVEDGINHSSTKWTCSDFSVQNIHIMWFIAWFMILIVPIRSGSWTYLFKFADAVSNAFSSDCQFKLVKTSYQSHNHTIRVCSAVMASKSYKWDYNGVSSGIIVIEIKLPFTCSGP